MQRDLLNRDGSALIYCIPLQDWGEGSKKSMKDRQRQKQDQQVPEAVQEQGQGCSGEELRTGFGASSPSAEPTGRCGGVRVAAGRLGRRRCGPSPRPHSPRTAQASRVRTASLILPGLQRGAATELPASAPPLCAARPFIPGGAGKAQSLTSSVCTARLPNRP